MDFISNCGCRGLILKLASGEIKMPDSSVCAPADLRYPFPPVLLPLWSVGDWPGYVGLARHWFGTRADSYVQFFVEDFSFVEIARNDEQLKAWLVFDFLCNVPEIEQVEQFADSIEFCAAGEVDSVFSECECVSDLNKLDVFKRNTPELIRQGGRFGRPEWLVSTLGAQSIDLLISNGRFDEAWFQLNSAYCNPADTCFLLNKLAAGGGVADQKMFKNMIDQWSLSNFRN